MFTKIFTFFLEKFIEPIADFFMYFIEEHEDEKSRFINPVVWFGAVGIIIIFILLCFSQIFTYGYYWILLAIYRQRIDDHDDRIQWCKDNNLNCYDFKSFSNNDILLFHKKQIHFIGFRTKKEAVYFKMNQE